MLKHIKMSSVEINDKIVVVIKKTIANIFF